MMYKKDIDERRIFRILLISTIAVIIALLVGVYLYYLSQKNELFAEKKKQLTAIGKLKATQIESWIDEKIIDTKARVFYPESQKLITIVR